MNTDDLLSENTAEPTTNLEIPPQTQTSPLTNESITLPSNSSVNTFIESNTNVTPMETDEGIRLVPQPMEIETSISTASTIASTSPTTTTPTSPAMPISNAKQAIAQTSNLQQNSNTQQTVLKNINSTDNAALLTKTRLRELVKEVDPNEQLEEDVEDLMLQLSDEFVDELVKAACVFAKHRKSNIVEVKDVQLYLERYLNMWIPGFGTDELKPYKKAPITDAHKQRTALIKKVANKKY
ncbi:transcription initiation factor TFIID subunit 12 [Daktulosphaira vitifoliae]|uniref:transcription initiation factor TFIID subunit 12 n=1 Tax=Daktulosphaira vitifoliae TaxID=58002 RepID=UPI0021AAC4F6|nr:transcription initiation factor TFIID subunit 12 [Daktulosphaira vitifoliae]